MRKVYYCGPLIERLPYSTFGRTAFTGTDWTAKLWQEYAKADIRWGQAHEIIVSLELLTVLIGGPLSFYIAYLLVKNDPNRHQWLLILSTGELYGGCDHLPQQYKRCLTYLSQGNDLLSRMADRQSRSAY